MFAWWLPGVATNAYTLSTVLETRGKDLPRKGYKTVCVTDQVYRSIQNKAKQNGQSIPQYINGLLKSEKKKQKKINYEILH